MEKNMKNMFGKPIDKKGENYENHRWRIDDED